MRGPCGRSLRARCALSRNLILNSAKRLALPLAQSRPRRGARDSEHGLARPQRGAVRRGPTTCEADR